MLQHTACLLVKFYLDLCVMMTSVYCASVQKADLMRKMTFVITIKRFTYLIMKICNAVVIHRTNITKKSKNIYESLTLIQLPD